MCEVLRFLLFFIALMFLTVFVIQREKKIWMELNENSNHYRKYQKFEGYIDSYIIVNNSLNNYQIDLFATNENFKHCIYHNDHVFNNYNITKLVAEKKLGLKVIWNIKKGTGKCIDFLYKKPSFSDYVVMVLMIFYLTLINLLLLIYLFALFGRLIIEIVKYFQEMKSFYEEKYSPLSQQEEDNSIEMIESV